MGQKLVVCEVLGHELELCGLRREDVILVEQGLHCRPDALRAELQRIIDAQPPGETIALAYGLCGNALLGLSAGEHRLVVPRVDDCIGMLLGSRDAHHAALCSMPGTYFLSRGFIDFGSDPCIEYERLAARFGPERARSVMRSMMRNYRRVAVIDTGVPLRETDMARADEMAGLFDMQVEIVPGSLSLLRRLFAGEYTDEDFIIVPPGGQLELAAFLGLQDRTVRTG